jgi:hypothetical protein
MERHQVKNCWEIKKCGRQESGAGNQDINVCPAASNEACDGINRGRNGGRICWAITGTLCGGQAQGIFALKIDSCLKCEVLQAVSEEEGPDFVLRPEEILPEHLRVPIARKKRTK